MKNLNYLFVFTFIHVYATLETNEEYMDRFYTVKEFAKLLRIHPNTVRRMIKNKRLNPINIATQKKPRYSIHEEDLLRLRAESFKEKSC